MPSRVPDELIRVEDKLYSAQQLAKIHPGGPLFVKAFAGRDSSQAFLSYHRKPFPHNRAKEAFYAVDKSVDYSEKDNQDFLELCELINKVLPKGKSFAPWHYFVKIGILTLVTVILEFHIHYTASYKWHLTALLGFLFALIGLNIQHDANHGAISLNPNVNRFLGTFQNWIGGSAISWIHQHVVQHHIHTNDVRLDPDIALEFYVRLNPTHPLLKFQLFQYFYFFILIAFYGVLKVVLSIEDVLSWKHYTPMSRLLKSYQSFEVLGSAVFMLRWIALPIIYTPDGRWWISLVNILPMAMVAGYYLSFFFTISHNFRGVHMHEDTRRETNQKNSFLYNQVVSSSNVGGSWLCFLNGGLNYQIEHHLFPRINHTHYPTIAPHVKKFCDERKIPYVHFTTIDANLRACIKHLMDMGESEMPNSVVMEKAATKMPIVS
nr:delta-6 fatty acid desaturase [Apocyclops royi]